MFKNIMFKNVLNYSTHSIVCKECEKDIDINKLYAVVYEKKGKVLYHIECFHKNYTPIEEKFNA